MKFSRRRLGNGAGRRSFNRLSPGQSLSVAAIADGHSGSVEVFPVGRQRLSDDGRFHYLGGKIPALLPGPVDLAGMVTQVCRSISGLAGYIGFDLILARHSPPVSSSRLIPG